MYKILKFRTPYSLFELLDLPSDRTGRNLLLRTRAIGGRHEEKSFFSQSTRFWNKHHKIIIEPSEVKHHTDVSKKLNLVGTKFAFFDFSTKVSTFKSKLKKLLLHTQSSGNEIDWTEKNYVSNWISRCKARTCLLCMPSHPLPTSHITPHHLITSTMVFG